MSILIKGMEMPETCEKCRMHLAMFIFSDGPIGHCMLLKGKADKRKCPLVPVPTPHGRLIDADDLEFYRTPSDKYEYEEVLYRHDINDAPTIIEAEGE